MEYRKLTVKYNKGQPLTVQQHHYFTWLQNAADKGLDVVCYAFERDSTNRLHIHGYVFVEKNFYIRKVVTPGFHVRIDPIPQTFFDLQGYLKYICKCQDHRTKGMVHKQFGDHYLSTIRDPLDTSLDENLFEV